MEIRLRPEARSELEKYAEEKNLTLMDAASDLILAGLRPAEPPVASETLERLRLQVEQTLAYQRYILRHALFVSVLLQKRLLEQQPDDGEALLADVERQVATYLETQLL